ncbi:hypothetical protein [Paenibacillus sp. P46E]|uniref:hypothetical protein n=1 Tax=Paenibacillus sp. P46E TaxID=1349436 RepID=UPI00093C1DA7|nr:hypothetical protein [Paenibacillus sp. P46E]OKP94303.1 hypothetical protein A3849_30045 [Paenibacillus sp. P46E]
MIIINADKSVKMDEVGHKHLSSLETRIRRLLQECLHKKKAHFKNVYSYLLLNVDKLLVGEPEELDRIITHMTTKLNVNFTNKGNRGVLYRNLQRIFNYKAFAERSLPAWGAYALVTQLNVKICPYCNRQYIFTVSKEPNKKGKTRGRLDHFYDKATYPYLALSLYNLIPCCDICNSDLKGSVEFTTSTHLHPYKEEFGDYFKFSLQMKSGDTLRPGDPSQLNYLKGIGDEFDIVIKGSSIDPGLTQRVENNLDIFKIKELYNMHKDYIVDLIKQRVMYSDSRIDELYNQYQGTLFSSREDVIQSIVSNYVGYDNLDKRVLAKLTRDIAEELNLNIT